MKKRTMCKVFVACLGLLLAGSVAWAATPPAVGGLLPDFTLTTPKDGGERGYLGLSFLSRSFKIPELKTQVVLIEIFSMYCPYCQAEAPIVNRLYEKIENNSALKGKIKLIGIGVGNSPYEVGVFKQKYQVPFPLIPDKDFRIHEHIGETRTPYFIGVKINRNGSHRVIYSQLGALGNVDKFLEELIRLGDLK